MAENVEEQAVTQEVSEKDDLMNLIPEERKIMVGRTKDGVEYYYLYPLSIKDFKKVEELVQKLIKIFMKGMGKSNVSMSNNLIYDFLPDLLHLMAISSFEPSEDVTKDEINKRIDIFESRMTFPQIENAVSAIFNLNKFDDILKNLTKLFQKSQPGAAETNITGGQRLKR